MSTTTKKEHAHDYVEKAKDVASSAADRAREAASHVGEAVSSAAAAVGHKAEDVTASVGGGMESLGERIRDKGPEKGVLGTASGAVASALESSGRYLQEKNLSGLADDVCELVRRNPLPALLVGVGLGFLLARTLRS